MSFGERVSFQLSSSDELGNLREAVWSVTAPLEAQVSHSSRICAPEMISAIIDHFISP